MDGHIELPLNGQVFFKYPGVSFGYCGAGLQKEL